MPRFAEFKRLYPQVEMELDFSDRLVDVIEEGFDAVIRTGEQTDSRLMARKLSSYRKVIVGSPAYLEQAGLPARPEDLADHDCLIYRYPSTGKLDRWPLQRDGRTIEVALPTSMVMNTLDPQISLAELGLGLACIPDMAVRGRLDSGSLISVLDQDYLCARGEQTMARLVRRGFAQEMRSLNEELAWWSISALGRAVMEAAAEQARAA